MAKRRTEAELVRADRQKVYGDFVHGHRNLGRTWAAMLSNHFGTTISDIPPEMVCAMMVALKLNRLSIPGGRKHHDNYVDAEAYLRMTEEASQ